ncbi:ABC transporter permease [uncultured Ruegeria sp.]|uniref:ABC transporter permease n=1 Tax=uncultured Ruegeria sp. TaxID=259304 RepID=UPI002626EB43|nr:ABC transporter permease [uncultured Ruegeria sp.]
MTQRTRNWLLIAPSGALLLVMLVLPLSFVFVFSFGERGLSGGYVPAFTLEQYANLPARWTAFKNTLILAPLGTLAALLIAYPLAYQLAVRTDPKWKTLLLVLVIVPFWTSILIRSYAWIYILGGQGLPALLESVGIENVRLIYTPYAVTIGIIYGYLPLMVFPIYVALDRLDTGLLEASSDLGARPLTTLLKVTLPLSLPGVATGCMLVFILLMGEFLIPALLGGGKVFFVGNALVDLFLQSRNWAFGSAVAFTLIVIMLITITIYMRLIARLQTGREDVAVM